MQAIIEKSKLSGRVYAPSSKSQTIRALVAAAMAKGQSCLQNALIADDTRAAIEVLQKLGASISHDGLNLTITGGNLKATAETLNCRDSAATLRFMAAICGTLDGKSTLLAGGSLVKRPLAPLLETLEKMGADAPAVKTRSSYMVLSSKAVHTGLTATRVLNSYQLC
jgi:3-phosphoshikimate 1-carboxyvinyltransferase